MRDELQTRPQEQHFRLKTCLNRAWHRGEWEDFRLHNVGKGVPLFINDGSKDAILLTIKTSAMLRLSVLDMRFVLKDALGDLHEVLYPCRALFPVQRALPDTDEETSPTPS